MLAPLEEDCVAVPAGRLDGTPTRQNGGRVMSSYIVETHWWVDLDNQGRR
jgi:hypothetical protein